MIPSLRTLPRVACAVAAMMIAGASGGPLIAQEAYRAPRTPDGTPDLQGIWQVMNSAEWDIQDHGARPGVPPGRAIVENNELPYLPAALAQKEKNAKAGAKADPAAKCFYPGTPRIMYIPHPFQIVQTPDYTAMLFEFGHYERLIYTDGFPHHKEIPFYMGDSRGKWDGETFVVDTRNFTSETWFDKAGNFHSDQMTLTERFTRVGPDHINYEATVTDPKTFSRPWTMRMTFYRRVEPDAQLLEYECFAMSVYDQGRFDAMEKKARSVRPPAAPAQPAAKPSSGRAQPTTDK